MYQRSIIDAAVDFNRLYELAKALYSEKQRHIWKHYEELADDARYTPECADLYRLGKEKIERVFARAKEKHTMCFTQYRGLA